MIDAACAGRNLGFMREAAGRHLLTAFVLMSAAMACDKPPPPPAADSPAPDDPAPETPAVSWTGAWAPALGALLVVPSDTDNTAIVVYPDNPSAEQLETARLQLVSGVGEPALSNVSVSGSDSLQCGGAPVVRLSGGSFGSWVVGLPDASSVVRSDSIPMLASADSARLVANLARMASALTAAERTRFKGLPFTVIDARRFTFKGTRIVAAHLVRRLPQEASPLEEHTFVIAERPLSRDSLVLRYSQRSDGTEETADHFEVLTAVASDSGLLLLLARDDVTGTQYQILQRSETGAWRVRWARALRC